MVEVEEQKKQRLSAQMDDWLTHLLAGWAGKLAMVALVPIVGYLFSTMMESAEKTRAQIEALNKRLDIAIQQQQLIAFNQAEVMRHIIVLEQRVLGYSTMRAPATDFVSPMPSLGLPPLVPSPPPPPPPPAEDKGAILNPTDKRRAVAIVPLMVRSGSQRR